MFNYKMEFAVLTMAAIMAASGSVIGNAAPNNHKEMNNKQEIERDFNPSENNNNDKPEVLNDNELLGKITKIGQNSITLEMIERPDKDKPDCKNKPDNNRKDKKEQEDKNDNSVQNGNRKQDMTPPDGNNDNRPPMPSDNGKSNKSSKNSKKSLKNDEDRPPLPPDNDKSEKEFDVKDGKMKEPEKVSKEISLDEISKFTMMVNGEPKEVDISDIKENDFVKITLKK